MVKFVSYQITMSGEVVYRGSKVLGGILTIIYLPSSKALKYGVRS